MTFELLPTRYGRQFVIPTDKYVTHSLRKYGEYSAAEVEIWRQLIPVGGIAFDVGANVGAHTLAMRDIVGADGLVFAFEPQLTCAALIRASATINQYNNIQVVPTGLSDKPESITLAHLNYSAPSNYGRVPLSEITITNNASYTVQLETVDLFCDRNNIYPHFIKVDVEGMERKVLEGARKTITLAQPWMWVECDRFDENAHLIALINDLGYRAYWTILPHFPDQPTGVMTFNLVCAPPNACVEGLKEATVDNPAVPCEVVYDDATPYNA